MRIRYELEVQTFTQPKGAKRAPDVATAERPRPAPREPKPPREFVDFNKIAPSQWSIHDRLENWGKWCNSRPGQDVAAGFGMNKSDEWTEREYGAETSVPVDKADAQRIQKAVTHLPDKNRRALIWYYIKPVKMPDMARELGVNPEGLAELVRAGRQMLINRQA